MKRYIIFGYYTDGPFGGWNDVMRDNQDEIISFDTLSEASEFRKKVIDLGYADEIVTHYETAHIVDLHNGKIVLF